jgi:hypothetical protein
MLPARRSYSRLSPNPFEPRNVGRALRFATEDWKSDASVLGEDQRFSGVSAFGLLDSRRPSVAGLTYSTPIRPYPWSNDQTRP